MQCVIAWVISFIVYRLGAAFTSAYDFGTADAVVIAVIAAAAIAAAVFMVLQRKKNGCVACSGNCAACAAHVRCTEHDGTIIKRLADTEEYARTHTEKAFMSDTRSEEADSARDTDEGK